MKKCTGAQMEFKKIMQKLRCSGFILYCLKNLLSESAPLRSIKNSCHIMIIQGERSCVALT